MGQVTPNFNKLTPAENIRVPDTAYRIEMFALKARYDKTVERNSSKDDTETKDENTQGNYPGGLPKYFK